MMDVTEYRNSAREKERVADLMRLLPSGINTVLDIGARDGFISRLLAERFPTVTALDLDKPSIDHRRVHCVQGDVTGLDFHDVSFDLVFCTEVLEHISSRLLVKACAELSRVSSRYLLIGVPYKQDIRVGRTTCRACGKKNPPWGHVNSFDERTLRRLFPAFGIVKVSFVGVADPGTNFLSCLLMDMAGNPYGTYMQDEPCVHCGATLASPPKRSLMQKMLTRAAVYARDVQKPFFKRTPNWIHVLFKKKQITQQSVI
jgi:SAM-dependent methyltransferase